MTGEKVREHAICGNTLPADDEGTFALTVSYGVSIRDWRHSSQMAVATAPSAMVRTDALFRNWSHSRAWANGI